jgi:hypothetical protein
MINLVTPMVKWKQPQPLEFVTAATQRYNFRNWQSGNDDSVYYNLNLPAFFKSKVVMPIGNVSRVLTGRSCPFLVL